MEWFNNAMKSMNNGLHNDSTLRDTTLLLFSGCAQINPDKLGELTESMIPEEAFSKREHPGLNTVIAFCENEVKNLTTAIMRK